MTLLQQIKEKAKKASQTIVLPEGEEQRTLKATDILLSEKITNIILIVDEEKIYASAKEYDLKHIKDATIINFNNCTKIEEYVAMMIELRKHKGLTREKALKQLQNPYSLLLML